MYVHNFELVLDRMREIYNNAKRWEEFTFEVNSNVNGFTTLSYHFDELVEDYEEVNEDKNE